MAMMARTQAVTCRVLKCNPDSVAWINSPGHGQEQYKIVSGQRRARYSMGALAGARHQHLASGSFISYQPESLDH